MSLYQDWQKLYEGQTQETLNKFWEEYTAAEKSIYEEILKKPGEIIQGRIDELAKAFHTPLELFMGFLDGINESIKTSLPLEELTEESEITLDIDLEKLYYNMLEAKADYLYQLPEWDQILTEEKRAEITKAYRKSGTVVKGEKIGRNDPCSCGSGKKYKKCCGAGL